MALGYHGKLYILAFDHRGSFQKKMFGIEGEPTPEQTETIADAKRLIFEGMLEAVGRGAEAGATGVLVDEQFGSTIPSQSREHGLKLSMSQALLSCVTSPNATIRASGETTGALRGLPELHIRSRRPLVSKYNSSLPCREDDVSSQPWPTLPTPVTETSLRRDSSRCF